MPTFYPIVTPVHAVRWDGSTAAFDDIHKMLAAPHVVIVEPPDRMFYRIGHTSIEVPIGGWVVKTAIGTIHILSAQEFAVLYTDAEPVVPETTTVATPAPADKKKK